MTDPFASPKGDPGNEFVAAYDGDCATCDVAIHEGDTMYAIGRAYVCVRCWEEASGIEPW